MLANLGEIGRVTADNPKSISPSYFKRSVQDVSSASINFGVRVNMPKPKALAARQGLRFEKTVLASLVNRFTDRLVTGVPLSFQEAPSKGGYYQRPSTAIPDGLLLSPSKRILLILEIKLRHSTDAWFQLNRFYLPILQRAIGNSFVLRTLEICRYYDPGVRLPEEKKLLLGIEEAFRLERGIHPVLIWEKGA